MAQKLPKFAQMAQKLLKMAQKLPKMAQKLAPAEKNSTDISAASAAFCISAGSTPYMDNSSPCKVTTQPNEKHTKDI